MKKSKVRFSDYELTYYLKPGKWMSDDELLDLHKQIILINNKMEKKNTSGIFKLTDPQDIRDFLKKLIICVIRLENGELAGFFYNFIIEDFKKPIIHLGLVVILKNTGKNVMYFSYAHSNLFLYQTYGPHFITNISGCPSIIGTVSENFTQVWPSPVMKNGKFPPQRIYKKVASKMIQEYMGRFFPEEFDSFDERRFILKSKFKEAGFSYDLRSMARHKNVNTMYFCHIWINYKEGEDLVQVGKMTLRSYARILLGLKLIKLSCFLRDLVSLKWGKREPSPVEIPVGSVNNKIEN